MALIKCNTSSIGSEFVKLYNSNLSSATAYTIPLSDFVNKGDILLILDINDTSTITTKTPTNCAIKEEIDSGAGYLILVLSNIQSGSSIALTRSVGASSARYWLIGIE